jgi:hypothetical protein
MDTIIIPLTNDRKRILDIATPKYFASEQTLYKQVVSVSNTSFLLNKCLDVYKTVTCSNLQNCELCSICQALARPLEHYRHSLVTYCIITIITVEELREAGVITHSPLSQNPEIM